jgi:hypothetical protein
MKTTVEVSDDLYRRAKSEAALRGRKLKDLVEEGLRLVLDTPSAKASRPKLAGLMKNVGGREERKPEAIENLVEDVMEIGRHCAALPLLDQRRPDEILGYDEHGLPQ